MINIAVLAGGDSGEYQISMKSGRQVELFLDHSKYRPFLIEIRGASWKYRIDRKSFAIDKNDFSLLIGKRKIRFQMVFNAIHGTPGENGKLQGYFDLLGIPYTSCNVTTSAITFNKHFCKAVVSAAGVKTPRSIVFMKPEQKMAETISKSLDVPVFIKPNNGGSSVGMSKVHQKKELNEALEKAFREDNEVLVEEFIRGRELTCGVLRTGGRVIALPVTEIIPKKEFFDYEAKYRKGMSDEVVPAEIPDRVAHACRSLSETLYEKLNCSGVVRFDYIYDGKDFWFLEVNTVPGLTSASIVPKMAEAQGWTFTELLTRIIEDTYERAHLRHKQ